MSQRILFHPYPFWLKNAFVSPVTLTALHSIFLNSELEAMTVSAASVFAGINLESNELPATLVLDEVNRVMIVVGTWDIPQNKYTRTLAETIDTISFDAAKLASELEIHILREFDEERNPEDTHVHTKVFEERLDEILRSYEEAKDTVEALQLPVTRGIERNACGEVSP